MELIAGLRYDAYSLQGGGTETSGDHISPKITLGFSPFERTFLEGLQLYGTYAEGYRSPSITETLISGTHPGGYFDFLPNTNLKPETAHNSEFGINYQRDGLIRPHDKIRLKAAYFHNQVDDYIDTELQSSGCTNTLTFQCYQYQNIENALIEGWELEASYGHGLDVSSVSPASTSAGEDVDTGGHLPDDHSGQPAG